MGYHHHIVLPDKPDLGLLLANRRTESTFEEIPVIDIQDAKSVDPTLRRQLADRIRDACINVGFFYVKNHGIPEEDIANTIKAARQFFALPESTKMGVRLLL